MDGIRREASHQVLDAKVLPVAATPEGTPQGRSLGLLVMKFSGASLATAESWRRVAGIVRDHADRRPVVVLSAIGQTTNELVSASKRALEDGTVDISAFEAAHRSLLEELGVPEPEEVTGFFKALKEVLLGIAMLKELPERTRDLILSFGERICVRLFAAYFARAQDGADRRLEARALDSWDIGMQTTSGIGSVTSTRSQVEVPQKTFGDIGAKLDALLGESYPFVPVVTGYIAKDPRGFITTLGRHGSDQTAAIIGAAVGAPEVQLWKDVGGVFTADRHIAPAATPVRLLTFEQMAELSAMSGTYFVHPATILPAWKARIPIAMRSVTAPEDPGTTVVMTATEGSTESGPVATISSKRGITMVTIRSTRMLGQHGFLASIFELFEKFGISVDVVTTSEVSVSLTLDPSDEVNRLPELRAELQSFATVEVVEGLSMVMLLRAKARAAKVLAGCFECFEELGVEPHMTSHGASDVNTTFVLADEHLESCVRKLHTHFFE